VFFVQNMVEKLKQNYVVIILMCLMVPFFALSYTQIFSNANGDHLAPYRWVHNMWNGTPNFMMIDRESPRLFFQVITAYVGYMVSMGNPFGTTFFVSMVEVLLFFWGLYFLKVSLLNDKDEVFVCFWVFLCVFFAFNLTNAISPNWTAVSAIIHPMRHTSAIAAAFVTIALFFHFYKAGKNFAQLNAFGYVFAFVFISVAAFCDKLYVIWGLGPFVFILFVYRLSDFLRQSDKLLKFSVILAEAACVLTVSVSALIMAEVLRDSVVGIAGATGLAGVTDNNIVRNLVDSPELLNRVFLSFSSKTILYHFSLCFIAVQFFLEIICRIKLVNKLRGVSKFNEITSYIGVRTFLLCLSVFLCSSFGMLAARAFNYRYVEFLDIVVFLSICLIINQYFLFAIQSVKSRFSLKRGYVFGSLIGGGVIMSCILFMDIMRGKPETQTYQNIATWIEGNFSEQRRIHGLAGYWPAHQMSAISNRLEVNAMHGSRVQPYIRWDDISTYFIKQDECYKLAKIDFVLSTKRSGSYKEDELRRVFGQEDDLQCLQASCEDKLYIYRTPRKIGEYFKAGRVEDQPTHDQSLESVLPQISPEIGVCSH